MKLMTKAIEAKIPLKSKGADPIVHVKFFDPFGSWSWYGIEYNPKTRVFFGLVDGFEQELGSFSLDELESLKIMGNHPRIERDMYFEPKPLSEVRSKL